MARDQVKTVEKMIPLKVTADGVQIGAGTSFSFTPTSGSVTPMARIVSFTPNKITVAKVALDCFDNALVNGLPVEDCVAGWISPGTYSLKVKSLKTVFATHFSNIGKQGTGVITKANGQIYTFPCYLMEVGDEIPLKEHMEYTITLQLNTNSTTTPIGALT